MHSNSPHIHVQADDLNDHGGPSSMLSTTNIPTQPLIHYIPVASPPTPSPSPGPFLNPLNSSTNPNAPYLHPFPPFNTLTDVSTNPIVRRQYLTSIITSCTPQELLFISQTIAPLLKRDFLEALPIELGLLVLRFVDDPKTLTRAMRVSRRWMDMVKDESVWRRTCAVWGFDLWDEGPDGSVYGREEFWHKVNPEEPLDYQDKGKDPFAQGQRAAVLPSPQFHFSYRRFFKHAYVTRQNWLKGGHLLRSHRLPIVHPDNGTVTSLALDSEWVVVGRSNSTIKVYSALTGVLARTLVGHDSGVWGVCLVSRGGTRLGGKRRSPREGERGGLDVLRSGIERMNIHPSPTPIPMSEHPEDGIHVMPSESHEQRLAAAMRVSLGLEADPSSSGPEQVWVEGEDDDMRYEGPGEPSHMSCASQGWGQPNSLIVSGGCDKVLRVWDVDSGRCIYVLHGHTSTIRSLRVLHGRPIAVTGSRDATLRVWDVQKGRCLRVLEGHHQSVRCLDVCGNRVVSGSYDTTCRLWNIDTGECLHVLEGHFHQIYSVAFDGVRIATGSLDTTVRVWDAQTGGCLALLQGHTALVCQLQLSPTHLATGGSDGRVITFSLKTYTPLHRIAAHDSSVTSLQFDVHLGILVTGGNDGRVRVFEIETGNYVRDLCEGGAAGGNGVTGTGTGSGGGMTVNESVWKVGFDRSRGVCAIMCRRAGKTVVEIWSMRPGGRERRRGAKGIS